MLADMHKFLQLQDLLHQATPALYHGIKQKTAAHNYNGFITDRFTVRFQASNHQDLR